MSLSTQVNRLQKENRSLMRKLSMATEALESVLNGNRGVSGRIILNRLDELRVAAALAEISEGEKADG